MMMTITTTFHHHHHHPLVLSAISSPSSSFDFQFASHIGKRRRGTRIGRNLNPYSFITCRGLEDCSSSTSSRTKSSDFSPLAVQLNLDHCLGADRSSFSASYGRRGFTLMTSISVVFPLYWSTELLAAGELSIIQKGVTDVLSKAKAAGVLRMVFHDAGTFDMDDNSGGMNGSIVYELDRPENAGLSKTLKILEKAKREIDKIQQVSWADLIAVAGAEAVSLCGGPAIPVRLGRLDVRMPDPQGKLPQESLDAFGLKRCFLKKGFSTQELVALSGAHTLGSKGFGDPNVFDNAYFKILLEKPWTSSAGMPNMIGLPSDRALVEDDECLRWIRIYAADEVRFFDDFKNAYNKLVNSGALWRSV